MTQSVVNNLDILSKTVCDTNNQKPANSDAVTSDRKTSEAFGKILDKTIDKKECTLGDMKNSDGDMSDKAEIFKNVLIQATREVNMEKSLELTLARDITEIINQLKSAISTTIPTEENEDNASMTYDVIEEEEYEEEEADNTKDVSGQNIVEFQRSAETQPLFEQLLTYSKDTTNSEQPLSEAIVKEKTNITTSKFSDTSLIAKPDNQEDIDDENNISQKLDEKMLEELEVEILNSEADTQTDDGMKRQESPEEIGIKTMLNHSDTKSNIQFEKQIVLNSAKPSEVTPEKIIEQITKHFDSLKTSSKLNMVLNPESLGKVNLQIINSKDGLSAQFTVMTNDARELLLKGLDGLKEALLTQGVNVDNISIKISDTKEPYNPDWTEQENSENKNNREQQKQKQNEREKGLFEKVITKSLNKENGNI